MRGLTHRNTSVAVSFGLAVGGLAPAAHAAQVGPFHDGVCTVAPTPAETAAVSQMYANANESRALHERAYVSGFDAVYPGTRRVVEAAWADPEVLVAYDAYLAALESDTFELSEAQSAADDALIDRYSSRLVEQAGMPRAAQASTSPSARYASGLTPFASYVATSEARPARFWPASSLPTKR